MQAGERPIQDVIKPEHAFVIPDYQRPYTWDAENTTQLLTDIQEAINNNEAEYFIGSIVTIEKEKNASYEVVDGQQRLTTLSIVFSALRDLVDAPKVKALLQGRLLKEDAYGEPGEGIPRLTVRPQDAQTYLDVVVNGEVVADKAERSDSQANMIANRAAALEFFSGKSQAELRSFSQYLEAKVYLVFISALNFDSALRMFNVLNSRGVALSNGDLIKSHLYGQIKDQKAFVQAWDEIEANVGISYLDYFFGHLRTSIVADKARSNLFAEIRGYLKASGVKPENFVKQAKEASALYEKIFDNKMEPPSTRKLIKSLLHVSHDDWIPPMIAFFSNPKKHPELTPFKFVSLLEKATYQMWICGQFRDARNSFYYRLIRAIKGGSKESIADVFADNWNKSLFNHLNDDVYRRGFAKAVLLRIEMEMQDDSVEKTFNGPITVEHVLPQTMKDPFWGERFSVEEHQEWVHKLGNLTLLSGSKNSSAQNSDFGKKKAVYNERNKKVSFDLTKEVCSKSNWSPTIVRNRHDYLVEQAAKLWKI